MQLSSLEAWFWNHRCWKKTPFFQALCLTVFWTQQLAPGKLCICSIIESLIAVMQAVVKDAIQVPLLLCPQSILLCAKAQMSRRPNWILVSFSAAFICVAKQKGCILMGCEQLCSHTLLVYSHRNSSNQLVFLAKRLSDVIDGQLSEESPNIWKSNKV